MHDGVSGFPPECLAKEGLPTLCGEPAKSWISLLRLFGEGGNRGIPAGSAAAGRTVDTLLKLNRVMSAILCELFISAPLEVLKIGSGSTCGSCSIACTLLIVS